MSIRVWQACDMILSNTTALYIAGPLACSAEYPDDVTLTNSATAVDPGDTTITVTTAAGFAIPKNVEITFGTVTVITSAVTAGNAVAISIEPSPGTIAAGATATLSPLFEVYSANEASHTINENEVTDRVFGAGVWTTSKVTSRSAEISVNGVRIKDDPGLSVAEATSFTTQRVAFKLVDPDATEYSGFATVKGLNIQRQVDNNEQISFTLGVDGEFIKS